MERSGTDLLIEVSDFIQLYLSLIVNRYQYKEFESMASTIFKLDFTNFIV
jgi:hypothetical protein